MTYYRTVLLTGSGTYAARIARFRATVSLAIATGVAMTLKHGVDHLSKGAVDPADRPVNDDDSDVDVLAL